MLDLKFVKENAGAVRTNIENRFMKVDLDTLLSLYDRRAALSLQAGGLRQRRNENAAAMKGPLEPDRRAALVEEGKSLKEQIAACEEELGQVEARLEPLAASIPNMAHPDAPIGREDKSNLEISRWGTPPQFDFVPKDHVELALALDMADFDAATKVSGPKFYYLKNRGVFLELALCRYALDILSARGFTPLITPDIAREEVLLGIGFNPRGEESNIYTLEGTGTALVGTAEITLGGYYAGATFASRDLPVKLAGLSHCFRREAGAAGQYSKGLYRVHQFTKVEMFIYCLPEDSEKYHREILSLEEEIFRGLEIPYRVVDTCTGDLGAPAYRKFDLEAWMPGRGEAGDWGEITSASNCTDYQARRLGCRFKRGPGEPGEERGFVHMLNGTAVAVSRAMIAILENFQQADGSVRIPAGLAPYAGFDSISPRN
ncbi:MAG: serine--tRNA ligase [Spirochaetales bacterium]|jgi:seryl-tRNA synthetase|nr:serine--tRNA ligase [Spirochaetales bacterium]